MSDAASEAHRKQVSENYWACIQRCVAAEAEAERLREATDEFFCKVDANGGIPACPVTIFAKAAARLRSNLAALPSEENT
jgi:hypothetical protein